jgi:transposase
VRVAAPGSIPRGSGDRVKTDRRDATRLVRLLAAGELTFVFVPSVADERFRDLVRCIEDARGDLMRARHRLGKFLLRRGERYPGSGRAWTGVHMKWLRGLRFEDACSEATFLDYLAAVELLMGRRSTLIACSSNRPRLQPRRRDRQAALLQGHRHAVGRRPRRRGRRLRALPQARPLSGFLGIVPRERTSDQKRRQGAITKAGPGHARRLLVEAAHHYRHPPRIGDTLARRQAGQDSRVIEIAWRAQRRLNQRWRQLHTERRKPAGVTAIACARELAAFCWEAATLD